MINTGLKPVSNIAIVLGFIALILIPLYVILYLFYTYYLIVKMPLFLMLLPLILLLLYLIYVLIFLIEAKIAVSLLNHEIKEGRYKINSKSHALIQFSINGFVNSIVESLLDKLMVSKAITADLIFSLFGGKKGKNVMISEPLSDSYLLEFGDNVIVGKNALVLAHFIVGDEMYLKKTKVGSNVTIGSNAIVGPGVTIEDNVVVGANSFVKQDSVLKKNSLYAGNPAVFKKKI